jgi:hypothetical protein
LPENHGFQHPNQTLIHIFKNLNSYPQWVLRHREPKTEIKYIKGAYYKYSISYKYNPEKKRTDKITGVLLGKITEAGFVPSDKNELRTWKQSKPDRH